MTLKTNPQNNSSFFTPNKGSINLDKKSTEDFFGILNSLNIIDPESLSKDDISIILRRIDDYNGFFTTQQLKNIKYEDFSEHVFFDSAVNKVAYAFDRIFNIPYDKDELENIKYNNKTDGYTTHLLENIFPCNKSSLSFAGSEALVVFDQKGKVLNDIEKDKKLIGTLSPENQKFSFDFWLKIPEGVVSGKQIVFKKFTDRQGDLNGIVCFVEESLENNSFYTLNMLLVINGRYSLAKIELEKSVWKHIVISVNEERGFKKINFIINGNIINESSITRLGNGVKNTYFDNKIKSASVPFVIGGVFVSSESMESASKDLSFILDNITYTFQNLVGKVDEFRYFLKIRSVSVIKKDMHRNIFSQKGLTLYLRMNEPGGDYINSCLAIDYSGNKLHGILYSLNNNNYFLMSDTSNVKDSSDIPLRNEKLSNSPVLNAGYTKIQEIRSKLTEIAKTYDENNPNLIFNLMPKHYFLNSAELQSLPVFSNDSEYNYPSSLVSEDGFTVKNGAAQLGSSIPATSEIVNIVLIWARFFDQLKMYIASLNNFLNVDYDSINKESIVGMQIPILCKMYGIKFKEILPNASKEKLNNFNLNYEDIISEISIRKIQNILWQRFLINTQDFLRSKGTVKSLESTFNSFGIDHNKFIDIKEYSTFNNIKQNNNYYLSNDFINCVNFGNSEEILSDVSFLNPLTEDFSSNKTFLSIENIKTHLEENKGIASSILEGLEKDWSIEMFFLFKETIKDKNILNQEGTYSSTQCLFRVDIDENNVKAPVLVAKYQNYNNEKKELGILTITIQPIKNNSSYNVDLILNDVNLYDLPKYLCITQKTSFEENTIEYNLYLDDIGKQIEIKKPLETSKKISDITVRDVNNNIVKDLNTIFNNDNNGSFYNNNIDFCIGNYNYTSNDYLSPIIINDNDTSFQGEVFKIRCWKKCLDKKENKSHSNNIFSIGTIENNLLKSPVVFDFDFVNIEESKTVENNIVKYTARNNTKIFTSESYSILLNNCEIKNRNDNTNQFNLEGVSFKKQNANIDTPTRFNRVNVISYKSSESKLITNNFNAFPSNSMPLDFDYDTVSRMSIDMSIVKSINEDIANLISDLNSFTGYVSNYYSRYDYDYNKIKSLRIQYFEKLSDEVLINYASVGNVFKFFDNIMSSILYDIVPSNIRFEGFNYVYESHILERHKYEYKNRYSTTAIVSPGTKYDFSRESINFRRSSSYNSGRKMT